VKFVKRLSLTFVVLSLAGLSAAAQGTLTVLNTGGGQPLVTSSQQLQIPASATPVPLFFEFGFGTDEVTSPGAILDSFTVTVQDAAMLNTLVLVTADASGTVWAPPTPGGVLISPDAILRSSIPFPSLQPTLANQSAFAVTVPLPTVFTGTVNVHFDLFDNLDATASLGWYRGAAIPEPGTWALLVAGLLAAWMGRRRWRR
jgi:hypothetical protein